MSQKNPKCRFWLCSFIIGGIFLVSCQMPKSAEKLSSNASQDFPTKREIADKFAYPIGKTEFVTEAKDGKDDWYNARNFGEENHLGEDWNKNSGGNTDCGEPVFAAANGVIIFAEDVGGGWGNVVIIEHLLPDGKKVETLYGHLQTVSKNVGTVKKREKIGTVGNASGKYLCHLHFEVRDESCLFWNKVGFGYSPFRGGWLDGSEFIDKYR